MRANNNQNIIEITIWPSNIQFAEAAIFDKGPGVCLVQTLTNVTYDFYRSFMKIKILMQNMLEILFRHNAIVNQLTITLYVTIMF